MPSATFTDPEYTLHSESRVSLDLSTAPSDATTARAAAYAVRVNGTLSPEFVTQAGDIRVDLLPHLRSDARPTRAVPTLLIDHVDSSFAATMQATVTEVAVVRASGVQSAVTSALTIAKLWDTYLPRDRFPEGRVIALTARGDEVRVPNDRAIPSHVYFYSSGASALDVLARDLDAPGGNPNTRGANLANGAATAVTAAPTSPLASATFVRMFDPNTGAPVRTYRTYYDCSLTEAILVKEREGGYLTLGFGVPTFAARELPAIVETFPPKPQHLTNPFRGSDRRGVKGRALSLKRERIRAAERPNFVALLNGVAFWYWDRAAGAFLPCTVTGATPVDLDETRTFECSIQLYVD